MVETENPSGRSWKTKAVLLGAVLVAIVAVVVVASRRSAPPVRSEPLKARVELAAGEVTVARG
jgi:hypothetical protein